MNENLTQSPALKPLRKEMRALADEASRFAHDRVMDPAMNAMRHTRESMLNRASQAEEFASRQCDRLAHEISANPFAAMAIAFGIGWMAATLFGFGAKRA